MRCKPFFAISFCLLLCVSSSAQRVRMAGDEVGAASNGYIDVDIRKEFSGGGTEPLSIEVTSSGVPMIRTFASPTGSTSLGPLRAGHYTVIVSGRGISTAMEEVYVDDPMSRRHVLITVNRDPNEGNKGVTGSVNVAELTAPSKAKKHYGKGLEFARKLQWDKAIAEFKQAEEEFPNYSSAYTGLGLAYFQTHDLTHAEESFTKAVQLNPSDSMALRWLGKLRISARDFNSAERYLENADRFNPGNEDVLVMLAWAQLETGKTQASIATASRVDEKSSQAPTAHYIEGRAYEVIAQRDAAIEQYKLSASGDPKSPNVQLAQRRLSALTQK